MSSNDIRRITITENMWNRIAESVPRSWNGELYSWALRKRVDAILKQALDAEENKRFRSGAV